ncbi:MAG: hypothetical protein NVSMB67_28920 [Flavisolibacter sp.]
MQFQNNDIDDIFKKAAENYPLNTSKSNWEKISAALNAASYEVKPKPNNFSKGNFLLIFLLFTTLGITSIDSRIIKQGGLPANFAYTKISNTKIVSETYPSNQVLGYGAQKSVVGRSALSNSKRLKKIWYNKFNSGSFLNRIAYSKAAIFKAAPKTGKDKEVPFEISIQQSKLFDNPSNQVMRFVQPPIENLLHASNIFLQPQKMFITAHDQLQLKSASQQNTAKGSKKFKHVFVGLMVGPDLSNIKFQRVEKAGLDGGIVLGYKFKKRWSFETGIIFSVKNYYTKGEYFNTSKIYLPPNTSIQNASGECRMFELPLLFRFCPAVNAQRSWFGAMGISSYFMKSENYSYRLNSAIGYPWGNRQWSYKNSSKNWFSVVSLSAGFSQYIGRQTTLKIEPYVKLPLEGVGIASLPLMSSGIHLTLTKDLF